jgi:predicted enzyme related to lactoylglutathione lyase
MDNPVVNFQMPYEDASRVADFYSKVFGWTMINTGKATHNYIAALTTKSDGMESVTPSAINGGFSPKSPYSDSTVVVVSVKDIHAAIKSVQQAGGTVLQEPMDIPQVGMMASILDTENNKLSLLQH